MEIIPDPFIFINKYSFILVVQEMFHTLILSFDVMMHLFSIGKTRGVLCSKMCGNSSEKIVKIKRINTNTCV